MKLLVIGIKVESREIIDDDIAEPLVQELQRLIETKVSQIVKDMGAASGRTLEVSYN